MNLFAKISLTALTVFGFTLFSKAQCPVNAYVSKSPIVCGDSVVLTAVADGCKPLNNNFNSGNIGTDWQATNGAVVNDGTGNYSCVGPAPEGSHSLWMGADVAAPRQVETNDYDLTSCNSGAVVSATICFHLKYGVQGAPSPCEGIDLPAEGVSVQYSTNGGTTWTTLQYYDPNGGNDPQMTNWNFYCLNIPPAALTTATRFRWYQDESSGAGFDAWGLDDMKIILSGPGYTYDWAHDALAPAATSNTPAVQPLNDTTYYVTYTNGTQTCVDSVDVIVNAPTVTASADRYLVCEGDDVNLVAESNLIPLPPTECAADVIDCDPISTVAIEYQMGNGTVQSQTGNSGIGYLGASNFDGAVRSQFLLRANNLLAAGFEAGKFTSMQFDILSNEIGTKLYNQFEITFQCTGLTALPGNFVTSANEVTVFTPKNVSIASGWHTMFFDQGFVWDGVSNIIISMCWRSDQGSDVITRHYNVGYAATKTAGTNGAGANSWNCATSTSFENEYNSLPNFRFSQCVPRAGVLNYAWSSIPAGFTSNVSSPTANPTNNPTQYIVSVNEQGRPAGCAVTDTVEIETYVPAVTVTPNPANICPPATTSVNLTSTATTNNNFFVPRTYTNNTAQAVPESQNVSGTCTPFAGTDITSVINVTGAAPATVATNPVQEVVVNMNCVRTGDYEIRLTSPGGQTVLIFDQHGTGGNITNMRLRPNAAQIVNAGASPFNGVFRPLNPFTGFNGNVNGNWTLSIRDNCAGTLAPSTGNLISWSITFNSPNYISSYLWSPAADLSTTDQPNTTASPSNSTTYTLTVTDGAGCEAQVQVPVNVSSAPTIPVNDTTICVGGTATLTAVPFDAGGGSYTWSPTNLTTQSINVSPTSTTGYSVSYSNGGCTGTGSGTVTVVASPELTINPQTICAGQTANLNAIPTVNGGTWTWNHGPTTQQITVSPTTTQYYYVTYDIGGCSVYDSVLVTVSDAGTVTVNDETICGGNTAALTATVANAGGTFTWTPGNLTTQTINVSPVNTTTYTVTYDINGCTTQATGTVTVNSTSTVTVNDATLCNSASATLTAVGSPAGGTYLWQTGGQTTASITVSPAATTTYTVDYTVNGCTSSATSTVTVGASESVTVADQTICAGNSASLTATPTTSGGTYLWTPGNQTTQTINVSPSLTTQYTVTYTLNGCDFTDDATVTVNPAASVVLNDTTICLGDALTLSPSVNPTGGTYTWSTGANTATTTLTPTGDTTIYLTYAVNGCTIDDSSVVTAEPLPTATMSGGGDICSNQTATIQIDLTGAGPWDFVYTDGTNSTNVTGITTTPYTFTTNIAGTYSLLSVSNTNCTGTTSGNAVVSTTTPLLSSNVTASCDAQNTNYVVSFEITGGNPAAYAVTGMTGGTISATAPYIFTSNNIPAGTNNYSFTISDGGPCGNITVTGTQNCGCSATANISGGGDVCPGDAATITLTMTGTGPWDVVYNDGTANTTLTGITSPHTFTTTTPGNYTLVSVTDATACNGSVSGNAQVNQLSNPTVSVNSPSICLGETANLVANPNQAGGTYSWSNGATTQTVSVTPGAPGTSSLTVTYNLNGCTNNATGTITTNTVPDVSSNDTTICAGSGAFLYANATPAGGAYVWTPVNTNGSTVTVNPSATANYTVTYTLNGCSDDDISTVTVNPAPVVSVNDETVCTGAPVTLTGSVGTPGGTFLWSPGGQTTQSITVNPGVGTFDYELAYTLGGCTTLDTGTVTMTNNPTISVADVSTCSGQPATLNAVTNVQGGTFIWGPGNFPDTSDLEVSPNSTTTYTVTYDLGNCSANTSATVTVSPSPSITVSDQTICAGETATLNSTTTNPGGTYAWSPGTHPDQATLSVSPATTTMYYLNYTINGCTVLDSGLVTVNNSASVALSDTNICVGGTATLNAVPSAPGGTYTWAPGGATTQSITVTPNNTTTYTVSYSVNGCSSSTSADVIVNPIPTVQVTDNVTICEGNSTTLIATPSIPNGTFEWLAPQANGETTQNLVVSPTTQTTYTVEYTLNGCSNTGSGTVNVTPAATISTSDVTICEGELATITATTSGNANNITWSPGGFTGPQISVSPNSTTTYTCTITDGNCTNSDQSTVTVTPIPVITASNTGPYCEGEEIFLNVTTTNGATYSWAGPNDYFSNTQNPNRPNSILLDSGEYQVLVQVGNCSAVAFTTVTINELTQNTLNAAGPFCANDAAITVTGTGVGGTYSGAGITDQNTGLFDPSFANPGPNVVTYTPPQGVCESTASTTILIEALPNVNFSPDFSSGCAPYNATFTDLTTPVGSTLSWDFGDGGTGNQAGTAIHQYTSSGLYDVTLTATSPAGCINTITKTGAVDVLDQAVATFSPSSTTINDNSSTVDFTNNSLNADQFTWIFDNEGESNESDPSFTFSTSGDAKLVTLIATNAGGCADTTYFTIEITEDLLFFIPNTFTPDGDKFNNTFDPVFTAGYDPNQFNFQVFNRWGELVFQSSDPNVGWDGTYQNQLAQTGVYIWKVDFKSSNSDKHISQTGTVNLLR